MKGIKNAKNAKTARNGKMRKIATNIKFAKMQIMEWMHKGRISKKPKSKDCQISKEGTKNE